MKIRSFGYIGFQAPSVAAWEEFARQIMGAQTERVRTPDGQRALRVRLDDKCQRMLVIEAAGTDESSFGFELASAEALIDAERELASAGIATRRGSEEEAAFRGVAGLLMLRDPLGQAIELFHGLAAAAGPFTPARPMGGFCAGDLGFGHAVLMTTDFDRSKAFYTEVLGFRVSDHISVPNRRVFMHVNERHHSLALAESPQCGIAHLMVEVNEFDDLGRALDVVLRHCPEEITSGLGRHSNDFMTSFYVRTPSGFPLEYGWGGLLIGPDWEPQELFGPSLWGHDRRAGTPAARAAGDRQRQYAFEQGIRADYPLSPSARCQLALAQDQQHHPSHSLTTEQVR